MDNDIKHFVQMKNCSFSLDALCATYFSFRFFRNIYRFSQVKVDEDELNDFNIPAQPNIFTYFVSATGFFFLGFFLTHSIWFFLYQNLSVSHTQKFSRCDRFSLTFLLLSLVTCPFVVVVIFYLERYPVCEFLFVSKYVNALCNIDLT